MKWSYKSISLGLIVLSSAVQAPAYAASGFSTVICSSEYTEAEANTIVRTVFEEKFQRLLKEKKFERLAASGTLSNSFVERNTGLKFIICDNPGGFDTLSVDGTGVAFSIQMVGLLMAQARALIAGATINQNDQLALHRELMQAFITQGAKLNINPIQQVEKDALATGMKASEYKALLVDPKFKEREQALFLVALNFLSFHERCHFGLDHGSKILEILKQPVASQPTARYKLEFEADKCAMDIINADEKGFAASPVSYFGLLMTVTTQTIVSAYAPSPETSSHPSSRTRLAEAQKRVLQFVAANRSADTEKYQATIQGVGAYMASMLDSADAMRASRSKER
jgi:hypothetical protein